MNVPESRNTPESRNALNVLLIGGGGREHALAWAFKKSALLRALYVAPGNGGTMPISDECDGLDITDHAAVIAFCKQNAVNLVVVGPEAPLVAGIADALIAAGIPVFGPTAAAAQLEGSKDFTKSICDAAGIPTAAYATFTGRQAALDYIDAKGAPIVVKYDGLMAGKGVTVAETASDAREAIHALYDNEPKAKVVIEEMLIGEEASFFCLVDGETVVPFGSAQDHKRAFDDDQGPNTGGMGAYSPAPVMTPEIERRALDEIVIPTAREMVRRGMPYRGILYAGLIMTTEGPKLIEYNCRFGDPECQVLVLRLDGDLLALLDGVAHGELARASVHMKPQSAVGVVMAAKGYPGEYRKGSEIRGLNAAGAVEEVAVFHAGTKAVGDRIVANGGRVLTICATGTDLSEARALAYSAVAGIDWPEGFCRSDIGAKGLARS